MVCEAADTESVECGDDNEDGGPTMVEGEGEMDKEFISIRLGRVVLLDDVVDVLIRWEVGK